MPAEKRTYPETKVYRSRPCTMCANRGVKTAATRILRNEEGRCERCYRQYGVAPIVTGENNERRTEIAKHS
jgi:hypothetical protein